MPEDTDDTGGERESAGQVEEDEERRGLGEGEGTGGSMEKGDEII